MLAYIRVYVCVCVVNVLTKTKNLLLRMATDILPFRFVWKTDWIHGKMNFQSSAEKWIWYKKKEE